MMYNFFLIYAFKIKKSKFTETSIMSLRLILMRHAKTELKSGFLTNRGQKTYELVGKTLSDKYWMIPTKVLSRKSE